MRAKQYRARRTAVRLRAITRRLAAFQRRARRAVTLGLAVATLAIAPAVTGYAQTGQTAMAPSGTGGVLGRAVAGFRGLNENGPGFLYYGINAADRGLGYRGSYMTLGGFIPGTEDDLGGLWAADVRGHLSEYGGFFSNMGVVRKQFIGGTLLGLGVFWDYDGDLNQYEDTTITDAGGTYVFDGGQVYNQVGLSGEWLTDFGNIRSNGYIPVGSTADITGPFIGNSILCSNGINAGLGGADLEVGAYIPGLTDWAGMISVGGYAYGNTRYEFPGAGPAVPWFGGVYTRLDMTLVENWDVSLQYNNDGYFDSTGFARLTYRMGGSRRRNVPDQVEQPMMRNEHIVRAHQAPVVALNPNNVDAMGNPLPWQIFHVDNSAAPGGTGSADAPFQTLADAQAAAVAAFDIVYVNVGNSLTSPYGTPVTGYSFGNENQYLVGEGTSIQIDTVSCGLRSIVASNNQNIYPLITNPVGTAINVDQPGTRVDHLDIANSNVGISDGAGFSAPGVATISDVIIRGTNAPFERGVSIANSTGEFRFDNVRLSNLGNDGFVVSAVDGDVVITNSSVTDVDGVGILASGDSSSIAVSGSTLTRINGIAVAAAGDASAISVSNTTISDTQGLPGTVILASGTGARVNMMTTTIATATGSGIVASGTSSVVTATNSTITATNSTITATGTPAVSITGTGATVVLDNTDVSAIVGTGVVIDAPDAVFQMVNGSTLSDITQNGINLLNDDALLFVLGDSIIRDIGVDAIFTDGGSLLVQDSSILNVTGIGIRAEGVSGAADSVVAVQGSSITNARQGGIFTVNSNLRVEQVDPTNPLSRQTVITNTGPFGILATANEINPPTNGYNVLVTNTRIGGVRLGLSVDAANDAANPPLDPLTGPVPTINFTALGNSIAATGDAAIQVSAIFDASIGFPGQPLSRVFSTITGNQVQGGAGVDIALNSAGDTTLWNLPPLTPTPAIFRPLTVRAANAIVLQNINNNAVVAIQQEPNAVNFAPGIVVPLPPPPPPIPPVP